MGKREPKIPAKTKEVALIPEDLKNKWGSIRSVATAVACFDKGYFHHSYATVVRESITFLAKLHETLVEDALKHPQAHMISELKEIQKQTKEEAKANGKKADKPKSSVRSLNATDADGPVHTTPS